MMVGLMMPTMFHVFVVGRMTMMMVVVYILRTKELKITDPS